MFPSASLSHKRERPPLHHRSTSTTIAQVLVERAERIIPFTRNPLPPLSDHSGEELPEAPEPKDAEWVDGFMDLFFVSALSAYNSGHEIATADQLGSYVGFFIVIWWTWTSQVFYDVRYETSSLSSRLIKFLQLCMFGVWASYADSFDLSFIFKPAALHASFEDQVSQGFTEAEASIAVADDARLKHLAWEAVTLVYVAGRILMLFQYFQLLYYTRTTPGYRIRQSNWAPIIATLVSLIMWAVSYGLSHNDSVGFATARIALAYGGIFIEIATAFVEARLVGYRPFNNTNIGGRFGLLTLVILGEGVISLSEVTRKVVQAFTFETTTYAQVFCAFLIVYLVFHVYFDGFTKTIKTGRLRSQWWSWIHFPTHLMIVLMFTGIKGSLTWTNINTSVSKMLSTFNAASTEIIAGTYNISTPAAEAFTRDAIGVGVAWPSWAADFQQVVNTTGAQSNETSIIYIRELSGLLWGLLQATGVKAEAETETLFDKIWDNDTVALDFDNYYEFTDGYLTTALGPTLYLAPVSGGFLVLTTFLTLSTHLPIDMYGWAGTTVRFTLGSLLCLTGLLDLGPGPQRVTGQIDIRLNTWRWASSDWLLPAIVLVYFITAVAEYLILIWSRKHYSVVSADSNSSLALQYLDGQPRDLEKGPGGPKNSGLGSIASSQQYLPFGTGSVQSSGPYRPRTMSNESRQRLASTGSVPQSILGASSSTNSVTWLPPVRSFDEPLMPSIAAPPTTTASTSAPSAATPIAKLAPPSSVELATIRGPSSASKSEELVATTSRPAPSAATTAPSGPTLADALPLPKAQEPPAPAVIQLRTPKPPTGPRSATSPIAGPSSTPAPAPAPAPAPVPAPAPTTGGTLSTPPLHEGETEVLITPLVGSSSLPPPAAAPLPAPSPSPSPSPDSTPAPVRPSLELTRSRASSTLSTGSRASSTESRSWYRAPHT